jgi:bifunctional non-homologous end joining protein LigD
MISADTTGRPNFGALQDDLKRGRYDRMIYYAFDLLHLDGFDTRAAPLIERKRVLQSFLVEADTTAPRVLYSEHFEDGVPTPPSWQLSPSCRWDVGAQRARAIK